MIMLLCVCVHVHVGGCMCVCTWVGIYEFAGIREKKAIIEKYQQLKIAQIVII